MITVGEWIDAGGVEAHHGGGVGAIVEGAAVGAGDDDVVANSDIPEECEMGVAMRGIDGDAALAGIGRQLDMTGTERQRLAAAAREHDGGGADPRHIDARHRPGVGPRPRLHGLPGDDLRRKRPPQQHLRQQRLGVDPQAAAEQDETGDGEDEDEGAAHGGTVFRCHRAQGAHSTHSVMPGLVPSDLAKPSRRYIHDLKAAQQGRRGWPGQARP